MLHIISSIFPIFAVLFLGTALRRFNFIDDSFIKSSNKLIYYICLPVLLFYKISSASLSSTIDIFSISIMLTAITFIAILPFFVAKLFGWSKKVGGTLSINSFRGNFAYMALPVCFYTLGNKGLVMGSVFMGILIPFVNSLAVVALTVGDEKKQLSFSPIFKNTVTNPLFLASTFGLLGSFFHLKFFAPVDKTLAIISQLTLPLALFAIGGGIRFRSINWLDLKLLTGTFLKLALLPAFAYFSLIFFNITIGLTEQVMIVMLASPSALVNYVMADQMNGDSELSTGLIIITTLGSIFSFIIWLKVIGL